MKLHILIKIFFQEDFSFTTPFTTLLFFPLVGQWLADHRMSNEKVFISL